MEVHINGQAKAGTRPAERNMSKQKEEKTNAMRILDRLGIAYVSKAYEPGEFIDGLETAAKLGLPYDVVYKTLVTQGASRAYYVFVLPIDKELDMKKAARAVDEKSVAMIHVKDLTGITGYVRGGCTAIGMKKPYRTVVSDTARDLERIHVSAGRLGCQLELRPDDLCRATNAAYGDILME
jgi:Cys-tRNA(Pro)/Cys-tRNA(Cys) deacylase